MEQVRGFPIQQVNWQRLEQQAKDDKWSRPIIDRFFDMLSQRRTYVTTVSDYTGWIHQAKLAVRKENGVYVGRFRYYYASGETPTRTEIQEEVTFHSVKSFTTNEYGTRARVSLARDSEQMYDQLTADFNPDGRFRQARRHVESRVGFTKTQTDRLSEATRNAAEVGITDLRMQYMAFEETMDQMMGSFRRGRTPSSRPVSQIVYRSKN